MSGNEIHPTAVLAGDVRLGDGNVVGPYAVLQGPVTLGDGNWIGPHAVIGSPSQFSQREPPVERCGAGAGVVVGDRCVVREFVTVHQGSHRPTTVGDRCYLMAYSHVPHDAVLAAHVTLSNSAQVGGHTWIGPWANIGLGATLHQFSVVGGYSMVGMQAAVVRPVPPFALVRGVPARPGGVNAVRLGRLGYGDDVVAAVEACLTRWPEPPDADLPPPVRDAFDEHLAQLEASERLRARL